jgi:uncharacterized membrane protein YgcG
MKHLLAIMFALLSFNMVAQNIPPRPSVNTYVYDNANILSPTDEASLKEIGRLIEEESSAQVVVYTTEDLQEDYPIEEYTLKLAEKWGIGQRGADNGVLIFISPNTRQSRIEVGTGLEGDLTDIYTLNLQQDHFNPNFRVGNYYTGIQKVMLEIKDRISPQAKEMRRQAEIKRERETAEALESTKSTLLGILIFVLSGGGIAFAIYSIHAKKKREQEAKLAKEKAAETEQNRLKWTYSNTKNNLGKLGNFFNAYALQTVIEDIYQDANEKLLIASSIDEIPSICQSAIWSMEKTTNQIFSDYNHKQTVIKNREYFEKNRFEIQAKVRDAQAKYKELSQHYDTTIWNDVTSLHDFITKTKVANLKFDEIAVAHENAVKIVETTTDRNEFSKQAKISIDLHGGLQYYIDNCDRVFKKEGQLRDARIKLQSYNTNNSIEEKIELVNRYFRSNSSDISSSLKSAWRSFIELTDIGFKLKSTDPLLELKRVDEIFSKIESYHQKAKSEVDAAKRKRDDEDRRRRQRMTSSSSYSSSSSSSRSSFGGSSFGGGGFSGGGSSNRW